MGRPHGEVRQCARTAETEITIFHFKVLNLLPEEINVTEKDDLR